MQFKKSSQTLILILGLLLLSKTGFANCNTWKVAVLNESTNKSYTYYFKFGDKKPVSIPGLKHFSCIFTARKNSENDTKLYAGITCDSTDRRDMSLGVASECSPTNNGLGSFFLKTEKNQSFMFMFISVD